MSAYFLYHILVQDTTLIQIFLVKLLILIQMDLFGLFLGYTRISSYFGKRVSPTSGASSSHSGIDIPAPEGTKFIAVADGEITFTQFLGAGGYTITLSFGNFRVTYCHCSPNYIVKVGDTVKQGQVIGTVGPKYVYGVKGNQYSDSSGRPTNGATTGCHLHLGIRIDGKYQNPLDFF